MNKYRTRLHLAVNQMDEFQLRLVWGFVNKLFGLPEQANIVEHREAAAA